MEYNFYKRFAKRATASVVILTILSVSLLPAFAKPAQAQFPVIDPALIAQIILEQKKTILERIIDGGARVAANLAIERIVSSTVKWANTGFEGNPAYVTDPRQYFGDIADGVAGEFIQGSDLGFLCSPFQSNIRLSLAQQYYNPRPFQCTLTEIGGNIEAFYSDFSQGGWDTWFSMTQNENNNPYGAYLNAKIELDSRIAQRIGLKNQELNWNQGYLSWANCNKEDPNTGKCLERGTVKTPGAHIKSQLDKVLPAGLERLINVKHIEDLAIAFATGILQKYVFGSEGLFGDDGKKGVTPGGSSARDVDGDGIPDGIDNDEDGQIDSCFYGGVASVLGPPCKGSIDAQVVDAGGGGGSCQAVTESQVMSIVTKYSPSDAGLQQALPELRAAFGSQVFAFGTPGDVRDKLNFGGNMTVDVISNAGDPNASWSWILLTACGSTDEPTLPPGTEPASLISDLRTERNKYGATLTEAELGKLLNAVAWKNKDAGWVLLGKDSGANCPAPSGDEISCDILLHEPTLYGYDVLRDAEGDAEPTWNGPDPYIPGFIQNGSRTIVRPIAP